MGDSFQYSSSMGEVVKVLEEKYGKEGANAWFGHPGRVVRVTVEGDARG